MVQCKSKPQTPNVCLRNFKTLQGLTPVALYLIPKRHFGLGQRIRVFGHAEVRSSSKYPDAKAPLMFIMLLIVFYHGADLKWIEEVTGIKMPTYLQKGKIIVSVFVL